MIPLSGSIMQSSYGSFNPSTAFGVDLVGWWDASALSTLGLTGANVNTWTSRVNSAVATWGGGAAQPQYSATGRNSRPAIGFTNVNFGMLVSGPSIAFPIGNAAFSLASTAYNPAGPIFAWGPNGGTGGLYGDASGSGPRLFSGTGISISSTPTWALADRVAVAYSTGSGSSTITISCDGNTPATSSPGPFTMGTTNYAIGADQGTNVMGSGSSVQEILFVKRVMTTIERQQVEGYLAWKWGLQSHLPITHPYRNNPP